MPLTPKVWQNTPSTASPISAAALVDLEVRLAAYTDQETAARILKSLLDAKGDLIGASADNTPVRIPAATAPGQVLTSTSDGSVPSGNVFAAPAAPVIPDDSITAAKIAADAVGSSEIASGAVGAFEIAVDSVGASHLVTGSVGASEIADGSVSSAEIKNFLAPVTTLPSSPADGDVCFFQSTAMATAGVIWMLRYRAGATGSYKWEFVGGSLLYNNVTFPGTQETTASTTYTALATAGPSIALPLAGDYRISLGSTFQSNDGSALGYHSYDIGASGALDANGVVGRSTATGAQGQSANSITQVQTGLTAVTLTSKYRMVSGTGYWNYRWMSAVPVRVG